MEFRFGAVVGDARGWLDTARKLEDLGFSTLLMPDTLQTPSPFPALAAAAAVTSTLRLGTWVIAAPFRSPAAVVRESSTLQLLSDGRLDLGIGAGRPDAEAEAERLGLPWGTPGRRVDQLADTIRAVRSEVKPTPRIVVAGGGPRMLRLAAKHADVVALAVHPAANDEAVAAVGAQVRDAAGSRADEIELSLQIMSVGGEVPEWVAKRMGMTAEGLAAAGAAGVLSGSTTQMIERLQQLREVTGVSYLTVAAQYADAMAPVVSALVGT